ncbi:aldo/keto reductase [Streptomyces aureocirculatus]|uniref:aldo/keto reductase n=1 Tax=Streptomyces aureocirculatus TaxID=67275 RepID=UPI0012FEBB3D
MRDDDTASPEGDRRFLNGVRRAVEKGVTLLDTADSYGHGRAEQMLGKLQREYVHPLHLASKVGTLRGTAVHPYAGRRVHHQLQQTLDNLQVERLALYTLAAVDFGPADRYLQPVSDQMSELRRLGHIEAIGMRGPQINCLRSPEAVTRRIERFLYLFDHVQPDVLWIRFDPFAPAALIDGEDLFSFATQRGVSLLLAPPERFLAGVPAGSARYTPDTHGAVGGPSGSAPQGVSQKRTSGCPVWCDSRAQSRQALSSLALRYFLKKTPNGAVLIDMGSEQQISEALDRLRLPLTPLEFEMAESLYAALRAAGQPLAEDCVASPWTQA